MAGDELSVDVEACESPVGGGSVPGFSIPSFAVALRGSADGPDALGRRLRGAPTPVLTRIREGAVLFDVRTLLVDDEAHCARALEHALASS